MSLQTKRLFVAMELSNKKWKLAFGDGSRTRERNLEACDQAGLVREVALAKTKLGLLADAPVVFCYEAGRDGFWISRMLQTHGWTCRVLDPASIEVSRRARVRKTDRLDAQKLLRTLIRGELGQEADAFSQVRVPSEEQEAQMRLHRERERLNKERGGHVSRIKSLAVLHGTRVKNPRRMKVTELRDWAGRPLPLPLQEELQREEQRLLLVDAQMKELKQHQLDALAQPQTLAQQKAIKLQKLRAVGVQSSWTLSHECFGWRHFRNRKQLGGYAGLAGTPFDSGETLREQGISKAGSGRVRATMIELAWGWVRWQPQSALARWFVDRYVRGGTSRSKRKGIVALARKLLIALWKYVEQDIVPEGALLKA